MPAVSVVLPTFNRLQYLPEAVASIFEQTFRDWELLIADDGSDAQTKAYLQTLHDPPRVRLMHLPHTGRPAVVRNRALREATGRYIAFMDSDDRWVPKKLETQLASLSVHGDCRWSQTNFTLVDAGRGSVREMPAAGGWILGPLLDTKTVVALPSVIVSRNLLDEAGVFDEELVMCEDYDLWLRLAARSRIDVIDESLTIVRRHGEHYGNATRSFQDSLHVLDKALNSGMAAQFEPIIRRERAKNSASLARCYAAGGDFGAALRTLIATAPASCRHLGWWSEVLKAMTLALTPPPLRRIVRRYRVRSH